MNEPSNSLGSSWARHGPAAAFSLVELLIVIAVVGLLVGITVPMLAATRARSAHAKSLGNLHGLGLTLQMYAQTYASNYPFYAEGQELDFAPPERGGTMRASVSPVWEIRRVWPALMHAVAAWSEHYATWLSPSAGARLAGEPWLPSGSPPGTFTTNLQPSYRYANSFIANPETWSRSGAGVASIGPTRPDQVTYPSLKVVMFDADMFYLGRAISPGDARPVLMADASGRSLANRDALAGVHNRLRSEPPSLYHDTENGVRGRDVSGASR